VVNKQNVTAVILAGGRDFGRCPLASRLPTALWPLVGKPAIDRLLVHLVKQGIDRVVICSNGDGSLLAESIHTDNHLELKFLDEQLPSGTAGCVRDAASGETDDLLLVLPASMICPPKINVLISAHREGQSDLTVMFNPGHGNGKMLGEAAGIYICSPVLLEYIPKEGYFDIKEGLIPELLRAGKTVHTAVLPNHVGNFRDWRGYLCAIGDYLENTPKLTADLKLCKRNNSQAVWMAANSMVDPAARIYGRVVIMDGARISEGAVIFGPTILGRDVSIGKNSIVINSVLWDGAQVGPNCEIQRCLIDYNAAVPGNTVVEEKAIALRPERRLESLVGSVSKVGENNADRLQHALQLQLGKLNRKLPDWVQSHKTKIVPWLAAGLLLIAFLWSYRTGLVNLWNTWQRSDEYSSGLLVPFLAVYILWSRRYELAQCRIRPSVWGLFAFVAAQAVRLFGLFFMYSSAENLSIALSIAALVLLLFGWQFLRKVSTVLLFLCLMLPWPTRIQAAVALPLQSWATSSAVFCLEVMGYEVIREGNIIHIGQATVAVAEACNGLRMVTAFFVISGLVVLLVKRAWWEKLIVLASSLPVALLCNTARLTITALAFTVLSGEYWEKIFHDFGGYAMMPLALAAVVAELWLLAKLTTLPMKEEAIIITRQKGEGLPTR
ncbi:MAG TPA: exosortase, partial [Planctomycetes bacterium]|nr:exosortase [Planctomycetota bacterium]